MFVQFPADISGGYAGGNDVSVSVEGAEFSRATGDAGGPAGLLPAGKESENHYISIEFIENELS
jgi:hypothetical protein